MPKVYFLVRRMRIVRMLRNALCRGALRLCAAVRIMRMAHGFASVADNAQAGNSVAEPAFAEFAGFAWVILRGGFLTRIRYGRRERGASIASGCKPRFAGFAVCTPARVGVEFTPLKPKNGHPYFSQCWCGFSAISGPKNGKSATVKFGFKKGAAVRADPLAVCSQAMR